MQHLGEHTVCIWETVTAVGVSLTEKGDSRDSTVIYMRPILVKAAVSQEKQTGGQSTRDQGKSQTYVFCLAERDQKAGGKSLKSDNGWLGNTEHVFSLLLYI